MAQRKNRSGSTPSLSAADRNALEKMASTMLRGAKALTGSRALGGFQKISSIIIQDPTNPENVSICHEIVIRLRNGRFVIWCICFDPQGKGNITSGPCGGGVLV